jgi:hypothetical protein
MPITYRTVEGVDEGLEAKRKSCLQRIYIYIYLIEFSIRYKRIWTGFIEGKNIIHMDELENNDVVYRRYDHLRNEVRENNLE